MDSDIENTEKETKHFAESRQVEVKEVGERCGRKIVELSMSGKDGEKINLNQLLPPKDNGLSWVFVQGEGFVLTGSDFLKHYIQIPSYAISIDGDFGHDYEHTKDSKIDEMQHKYVEAHDLLKLDGAGYTILHEVGHLWTDKQYSEDHERVIEVRNKDSKQWTMEDYEIYKNIIIPMEESAWKKADELDLLLQEKGILIEPNWSDERKRKHKEFALNTYYTKLSEYESMKAQI